MPRVHFHFFVYFTLWEPPLAHIKALLTYLYQYYICSALRLSVKPQCSSQFKASDSQVPRALPHLARGPNPHYYYCQEASRDIWNHQTSIYNNIYLSQTLNIVKNKLTHCFQSAIFVCLKMQLNRAVRHYAAGDNLLKCWECWAGLLRSDTVTPGDGGAHSGRGAEESAADHSSVWPHRRKTDAPENTTSVFSLGWDTRFWMKM